MGEMSALWRAAAKQHFADMGKGHPNSSTGSECSVCVAGVDCPW